jgi:hypothetical protein
MARHRRKDALAWGLILIVLGIIFLLANIGVTRWDVWEFIVRLWPLALIIWGAWKLYFGIKERKEEEKGE